MPTLEILSDEALKSGLTSLDGWTVEDGKLHREFRFPDFVSAFKFMTDVAKVAEEMNHHPDWSNIYNRVVVDLVTHDAGALTQLDFDLARRMSALAKSRE